MLFSGGSRFTEKGGKRESGNFIDFYSLDTPAGEKSQWIKFKRGKRTIDAENRLSQPLNQDGLSY
jgi:hypothetical protein